MSDTPETPPGPPPPRPDYQRAAQDAMQTAQAAAKDAFATFMKLIYNPVGALPEAYGALGATQALGVGIVFVVVAVVCLLVSGGGVMSMATGGMLSLGFKGFLLGLASTLGCAVGIAAGSWLSRLLFQGQGNLPFDVFIGGATLLPLGLGTLASYLLGVIGIGGVIGQLPLLVGGSLAVLVVFTGLARVAGIKEGLASYLVALVLAVGLFVAYLVARMLGGMMF
ncbi:MAG: hypothetical protein IT479_05215 [Xanthomonadales bacterium]|nr:hypothetical protein [Xanthomonadales bacterium]MCC6592657.1 hypothetical protein [Xanthomonadales bacterium]MCE7931798.1 hypothetical protein [Xanthomonadales bacterium PRO6]